MSDHKPVKAVFAVDIDMSGSAGGVGGNQAKMRRELYVLIDHADWRLLVVLVGACISCCHL